MNDLEAPPQESSPSSSSSSVLKRNHTRLISIFVLVAIAGSIFPAIKWQRGMSDQTLCQSSQRRLATALLLYSADYEGCLPPPVTRVDGIWRTWVDQVDPYTSRGDSAIFAECPGNPATGAVEKQTGCPFPWSYALNDRFFDRFGPGPFPIENLELSAQTALIVESGRGRTGSPQGPPTRNTARAAYTDTATEPEAYPSPHDGRMNVAAADTHTVNIKVAHYTPAGHDSLLGRLGAAIYNWNGGHPNGDTAGPPHE